MKFFYRLRFLLLCISFFLLGFLFNKLSLQVKIAEAIQGTLNLGNYSTSTTTIQNKTVYQDDMTYGTGGTPGIFKANGNIGIGTIDPGNSRLKVMGGTTSLGGALSVTEGGASIVGGLNNNNGGITNTGAISGATNITLNGAISGGTTYSGSGNITSTNGILSTSGTGVNYFAGNVGIGSLTPGQKLTVAGTVESTSGGFKFPDGTTQTSAGAPISGNTNYVAKYTSTTTLGNSQIFDNGTNVGIGSITPGAKLDVAGTNSVINNTAGNLSIVPAVNLLVTQGNVGIGSTSPAAKLHIANDNGAGAGERLLFRINDYNAKSGGGGTELFITGAADSLDQIINNTWGYLHLGAGGGASHIIKTMTITSNNVGIGTTGPTSTLAVAGTTTVGSQNISASGYKMAVGDARLKGATAEIPMLILATGDSSNPFSLQFELFGNTTASSIYASIASTDYGTGTYRPLALNPNGGNVGIGTTAPGAKLDVAGNMNLSGTVGRTLNIGSTNTIDSGRASLYIYGYYPTDQSAQITLVNTNGTVSAADDKWWQMVSRTNESNNLRFFYTPDNGSSWVNGPTFASTGNVGISGQLDSSVIQTTTIYTCSATNPSGDATCTVTCPAGTTRLGGGCSGWPNCSANYPTGANSWYAQSSNAGSGSITGYVSCGF